MYYRGYQITLGRYIKIDEFVFAMDTYCDKLSKVTCRGTTKKLGILLAFSDCHSCWTA